MKSKMEGRYSDPTHLVPGGNQRILFGSTNLIGLDLQGYAVCANTFLKSFHEGPVNRSSLQPWFRGTRAAA
jgi:hypothetical protein